MFVPRALHMQIYAQCISSANQTPRHWLGPLIGAVARACAENHHHHLRIKDFDAFADGERARERERVSTQTNAHQINALICARGCRVRAARTVCVVAQSIVMVSSKLLLLMLILNAILDMRS